MNKGLQVFADWFHANKLSLNVSKSKHMLFSRSRHIRSEQPSLKMSDEIIQPTHCVNFLGLLIDDKLDWHEHINVC